MAGSFNNYLERKVLDLIFGSTAFAVPAFLYIGLSLTTIGEDGTGITEPAGVSYCRAAIMNDKSRFTVAAGTPTQLNNSIIFAFVQAEENWGTITDYFISDAIMAGNILAYGSLTVPKIISVGDTTTFEIGDFVIGLD